MHTKEWGGTLADPLKTEAHLLDQGIVPTLISAHFQVVCPADGEDGEVPSATWSYRKPSEACQTASRKNPGLGTVAQLQEGVGRS